MPYFVRFTVLPKDLYAMTLFVLHNHVGFIRRCKPLSFMHSLSLPAKATYRNNRQRTCHYQYYGMWLIRIKVLSCWGESSMPSWEMNQATAVARCTWTVVGDLGDLACVCTMSILTEFTHESWSVYLMLCKMRVFGTIPHRRHHLTLGVSDSH